MLPVTVQFIVGMLAYALNERMARRVDNLQEEVRVLKKSLALATGKRRIDLCADQRRRMAIKGKKLTPEERSDYEARRQTIDTAWSPANVQDLVDHIDYAVGLIGIDHVGVSSDFGGGGGIEGWQDASETLNVTLELVRRGYTEEQIRKLWGGNVLRVWRETERVAAELQAAGR